MLYNGALWRHYSFKSFSVIIFAGGYAQQFRDKTTVS